jgi:hypothetical protein
MKAHRETLEATNAPRMASHPPLLIADHRRPGEPMATLPLKLPADAVPRLQAQADRLRCNRTALGRALLLQALVQLEATAKPSGDRNASP